MTPLTLEPALTPMLASSQVVQDATYWMPVQASDYSAGIDLLFYGIYWTCVFFFVLIGFLMAYFSYKYRQKDRNDKPTGATHNTALELGWSLPPLVIVLVIFGVGFVQYLDMVEVPPNAYVIDAEAKQWAWEFTYPNGTQSYDTLVLPAYDGARPVEFRLTSQDVLHSIYIPAFRMKQDCVPGRVSTTWARPLPRENTRPEPQEYWLYCTEYCGQSHSNMNVQVYVYDEEEAWAEAMAELDGPPAGKTWIEWGETLYTQLGCASCHSLDGVDGQGPTWLNMAGAPHGYTDGSEVDFDYDHMVESMQRPQALVRNGYAGVNMAAYVLPTSKYDALYAFMVSISPDHATIEPWMETIPNPSEGQEPGITRADWLATQTEEATE